MEANARLAGATAVSQMAFGAELGHPRKEDVQVARSAVANAVWGSTGTQKAVGILFTLLVSGVSHQPGAEDPG